MTNNNCLNIYLNLKTWSFLQNERTLPAQRKPWILRGKDSCESTNRIPHCPILFRSSNKHKPLWFDKDPLTRVEPKGSNSFYLPQPPSWGFLENDNAQPPLPHQCCLSHTGLKRIRFAVLNESARSEVFMWLSVGILLQFDEDFRFIWITLIHQN